MSASLTIENFCARINSGALPSLSRNTISAICSDLQVFSRHVSAGDSSDGISIEAVAEFIGSGDIAPTTRRRRAYTLKLLSDHEGLGDVKEYLEGCGSFSRQCLRLPDLMLSNGDLQQMRSVVREDLSNGRNRGNGALLVCLSVGARTREIVEMSWGDISPDRCYLPGGRSVPVPAVIGESFVSQIISPNIQAGRSRHKIFNLTGRGINKRGKVFSQKVIGRPASATHFRWWFFTIVLRSGTPIDEAAYQAGVTTDYMVRVQRALKKGRII